MQTRRAAVLVNTLTQREIAAAIDANIDHEEIIDNADFASEEENAVDVQTGSESDYESEENEEMDDDEDCEMENDDETSSEEVNIPPSSFFGRDETEWSAEPVELPPSFAHAVRSPFHKVILPPGKHLDTISDCFRAIIDDRIINVIVRYTNIEARKHNSDWRDVEQAEILAFIGLLIIAGVDRSSKRNYEEFFGRLRGMPLFRATMGLKRFKAILKNIRFDDKDTRSVRRRKDKLAPIRDIFDMIISNLKGHYSPGQYLTIDEQLVPFRGRCAFKQYLPSKPDKYGLKIFWICDAETWYPLNAIPYLGRERSGSNKRKCLGETIASELCTPYYKTNRTVTFDNFFTSYNLTQELKAKGLFSVGTLRKNKKCIPREFLPNKTREVNSNLFGFRPTVTLLSHVPNKRRAVLFLSTLHHTPTVNDEGKAEINLFYNKTKGGVDMLDQLCHSYTTQRRTNRWPFAYFMNLLNVAGIAAFVLHRNVNELSQDPVRQQRKKFLTELASELTYDHIKNRSKIGLSHLESSIIDSVLNKNVSADEEAGPSTGGPPPKKPRRRCYICPKQKDRKTKQICGLCKRNVCNEHAISILHCKKCAKQPIINSSDSE